MGSPSANERSPSTATQHWPRCDVVASVQEAKAIRKACGREFLIVTPGVRPKDSPVESKSGDQARKATPTEAIRAGADFLVVGRPILAAPDPRAAVHAIVEEISAAK